MDFGIQTIYRCQFTNYSDEPLFKVSIALHLTFSEAIKNEQNPTSFRSGKTTIDRDWLIEIPKIDSGKATPFMFFILNASTQFVSVILPNKVAFLTGSDGQLRNVDLILSANAMMVFPPNPLLGGK